MRSPAHPSDRLPAPDSEALARSGALVALIRDEIHRAGGAIGFDRYMELSLYAPGLGYYAAPSRKFGAAGDFVTAPEMGPLFGACVATQIEAWLPALSPEIWEFGAGSGALAATLLAEFERKGIAVRYRIVEISAHLKARQRHTIAETVPQALDRVQWHETLPDRINGVVLANELLDALPVRLFEIGADASRPVLERVVCSDPQGAGLMFGERAADAAFAASVRERLSLAAWPASQYPPGYRSELGEQATAWVSSIAERMDRSVMLLIDYGFPASELYHPQRLQGTLNCHIRHHSHGDPLWQPGLCDITAHVDFSAIAQAARAAGLDCLGYGSQASFLLGCDLPAQFAARASGDAVAQARLSQQAQMLVSEAEMGELFKVVAFSRGMAEGRLFLTGRDRQASIGF